jgi:hypothetical protein
MSEQWIIRSLQPSIGLVDYWVGDKYDGKWTGHKAAANRYPTLEEAMADIYVLATDYRAIDAIPAAPAYTCPHCDSKFTITMVNGNYSITDDLVYGGFRGENVAPTGEHWVGVHTKCHKIVEVINGTVKADRHHVNRVYDAMVRTQPANIVFTELENAMQQPNCSVRDLLMVFGVVYPSNGDPYVSLRTVVRILEQM